MTNFLDFTLSRKVICQFTTFEVFKIFERSKSYFSCLLFYIYLLRKAKRKQNFSMSLHRKYYKKGATVKLNFWISKKIMIIIIKWKHYLRIGSRQYKLKFNLPVWVSCYDNISIHLIFFVKQVCHPGNRLILLLLPPN